MNFKRLLVEIMIWILKEIISPAIFGITTAFVLMWIGLEGLELVMVGLACVMLGFS